jgi:hypothetical protein
LRTSIVGASTTIWDARSSMSRQSSSRPSMLEERGVCRPTMPSAGRTAGVLAPAFGAPVLGAPARLTGFRGVPLTAPSPRIDLRFSRSGDCFVTREALSTSARLVDRILRFRGSTAPVVGVLFGDRPFFGRVAAVLCFLPNRFLSSLCAIIVPSLGTAAPYTIIRKREGAFATGASNSRRFGLINSVD